MTRRPADFDLWTEVAKSVKPLRTSAGPKHQSRAAPAVRIHVPIVSAPHLHVPRNHADHPPPLTGFDRRTAQKLSRGQVEIDGRLDLHGIGIEMARLQLLAFLRSAQARGHRTVLVITGKGDSPYSRHTLHGVDHFHAPERQGRLRRNVPEWLHEAEFRALNSGFQPAHPRHGGGGAFYVKVRRIRSAP